MVVKNHQTPPLAFNNIPAIRYTQGNESTKVIMKPLNILLLSCLFLLPLATSGNSFSAHSSLNSPNLVIATFSGEYLPATRLLENPTERRGYPEFQNPCNTFQSANLDSTKYRGYRLELTDFKLLKETKDWVKIRFTVVNSGRMNVDMGREGTEHWVVFNFDKSIFKAKLGGYRRNIQHQLAREKFKLEAGKSITSLELKVQNALPAPQRKTPAKSPIAKNSPQKKSEEASNSLSWNTTDAPSLPSSAWGDKGGQPVIEPKKEKLPCPDVLITDIKIIEENDKWATLQYSITNQGEGTYYLFGKSKEKHDNLTVSAYISGVTTLTRGAIPIGRETITEEVRRTNELEKGEKLTARIRLDIRKKTRYMKSLILSIENTQFADECDRKNNSMGVILK